MYECGKGGGGGGGGLNHFARKVNRSLHNSRKKKYKMKITVHGELNIQFFSFQEKIFATTRFTTTMEIMIYEKKPFSHLREKKGRSRVTKIPFRHPHVFPKFSHGSFYCLKAKCK